MTEHIEVRKPKPPVSQVSPELVEAAFREGYEQGRANGDIHHIPDDAWRCSAARRALMAELEQPVDPVKRARSELEYCVENPSAWENFDQSVSDKIEAYLAAIDEHGLTISKEG